MAMTKAERALVEQLRSDLALLSAFRLTGPVERDLLPPTDYFSQGLSRGWDYNLHSMSVGKACSSAVHHGRGWERTSSQKPLALFSTEERAWRALRRAVELQALRHLADIDEAIEACGGRESNPHVEDGGT